jgi:hypothetical protein
LANNLFVFQSTVGAGLPCPADFGGVRGDISAVIKYFR